MLVLSNVHRIKIKAETSLAFLQVLLKRAVFSPAFMMQLEDLAALAQQATATRACKGGAGKDVGVVPVCGLHVPMKLTNEKCCR